MGGIFNLVTGVSFGWTEKFGVFGWIGLDGNGGGRNEVMRLFGAVG